MDRKLLLHKRLVQIGQSVEAHEHGLALLGLGSVGIETERLDEYSDLDFFVICKEGFQSEFLNDIGWLSDIAPVSYCFQNTDDGYKLLFNDGVFCEFAIFDMKQLRDAAYAPGRIIWKSSDLPDDITCPAVCSNEKPVSNEFLLGELMTNLYVGMCRYRRGEVLSAMRFIQVYAFDRLIALLPQIEDPAKADIDPFTPDRRFEQRFPTAALQINEMLGGYQAVPQAAEAMLDFVATHFSVSEALSAEIRNLL